MQVNADAEVGVAKPADLFKEIKAHRKEHEEALDALQLALETTAGCCDDLSGKSNYDEITAPLRKHRPWWNQPDNLVDDHGMEFDG